MKKTAFIFYSLFLILCAVHAARAAACSRAALTQCLDSVCAANIGMNPAARCQLCGTANAGTPPAAGLKSISMGVNSKNIISASELKSAPPDPGAKYIWGTGQCIKKIDGCTADDVSNAYDGLIEQSCKSAGISAKMAELHSASASKTSAACESEIKSCIINANRCGPDLTACKEETDFDKFFSSCAVEAVGCESFNNAIRAELFSARNSALENQEALLANKAQEYQDARARRLSKTEESCKNNKAMNDCVETVCDSHMRNKCGGAGSQAEKSMAALLCKFHETACSRLK